jgi:hypothetical protein
MGSSRIRQLLHTVYDNDKSITAPFRVGSGFDIGFANGLAMVIFIMKTTPLEIRWEKGAIAITPASLPVKLERKGRLLVAVPTKYTRVFRRIRSNKLVKRCVKNDLLQACETFANKRFDPFVSPLLIRPRYRSDHLPICAIEQT